MITPIILSESHEDDAQMTFTLALNDLYTLLVALGTQKEAMQALSVSDHLINSGSANYASVRVIHAPRPEFILPILVRLKINPDIPRIDWSHIGQYAILSISNNRNYIGGGFKNIEFQDEEKGKISYIILQAQSIDDQEL
jgi:hypothetical protein